MWSDMVKKIHIHRNLFNANKYDAEIVTNRFIVVKTTAHNIYLTFNTTQTSSNQLLYNMTRKFSKLSKHCQRLLATIKLCYICLHCQL